MLCYYQICDSYGGDSQRRFDNDSRGLEQQPPRGIRADPRDRRQVPLHRHGHRVPRRGPQTRGNVQV